MLLSSVFQCDSVSVTQTYFWHPTVTASPQQNTTIDTYSDQLSVRYKAFNITATDVFSVRTTVTQFTPCIDSGGSGGSGGGGSGGGNSTSGGGGTSGGSGSSNISFSNSSGSLRDFFTTTVMIVIIVGVILCCCSLFSCVTITGLVAACFGGAGSLSLDFCTP